MHLKGSLLNMVFAKLNIYRIQKHLSIFKMRLPYCEWKMGNVYPEILLSHGEVKNYI